MQDRSPFAPVFLADNPEELAGAAAQAGHELLGGGGVHVQIWARGRAGGVLGASRGPEMSSTLLGLPLVARGRAVGEIVVDAAQLDDMQRSQLELLVKLVARCAERMVAAERHQREAEALVAGLATLVARREESNPEIALRRARLAAELSDDLAHEDESVPADLGARLALAMPLLELGKLCVPEALLLRRGVLSSRERGLLRAEAELGEELLADAAARAGSGSFLELAYEILATREERWDGAGPRARAGAAIPLAARIAAVVIAYDTRCTESGEPAALACLLAGAGSMYDPRVVAALERLRGGLSTHEKAA
jgi:response regulator RpfG family c-di-GMP phosphodiesterase